MRDMREQWEANLYDLFLDDIAFRGLDYEERSRRAKEEAEDVLEQLERHHNSMTKKASSAESVSGAGVSESEFSLKMSALLTHIKENNNNKISSVDVLDKTLRYWDSIPVEGDGSSARPSSRIVSQYYQFLDKQSKGTNQNPGERLEPEGASSNAQNDTSAVVPSVEIADPTEACSDLLDDDAGLVDSNDSLTSHEKRMDSTMGSQNDTINNPNTFFKESDITERGNHSTVLKYVQDYVPEFQVSVSTAANLRTDESEVTPEVNRFDVYGNRNDRWHGVYASSDDESASDYDPDPFWRCHKNNKKSKRTTRH